MFFPRGGPKDLPSLFYSKIYVLNLQCILILFWLDLLRRSPWKGASIFVVSSSGNRDVSLECSKK